MLLTVLVFVSIFVGWVLVLALCVFGLGELIKWQARRPHKRFFAPVPRPGSFIFPALEGKVKGVIENVNGWHLEIQGDVGDAECFCIGKKSEEERVKEPWYQLLLENQLGIKWIGLYQTIKELPEWEWSELEQIESVVDGEKVLRHVVKKRDPITISEFFFQFPYPVTLEGAEIGGNLRVKIVAVFTVLHLHPVRAFYLNKDPVTLFNAMILSALRDYVKDMPFEKVKGIRASTREKGDRGDDTFYGVLRALNGIRFDDNTGNPIYDNSIDPLGLFGKLGFAIVRGEILQVETTGATADALEAERLAELQGNAEVTKAKKEAQALDERREARMRWVRDTIVVPTGGPGPQVANVLEAEQVASKDSKVSTWVKGGGAITAVSPKDS